MDDLDLLAKADEPHLFAYPAKLMLVSRGATPLRLPAMIKDISHAGATIEFEQGHLHDLAERMGEGRVRVECTGPRGNKMGLVGKVKEFQRRSDGLVLAQIDWDNIHLPEVEEIMALRSSTGKDQRLLWELWDRIQEEGA